VNAFLDDGSDSTYVREDIVTALGLKIQESELTISTITGTEKIPSGLVGLTIESLDGGIRRRIGARSLKSMCEGMPIIDWCKRKKEWKHLEGIYFPRTPGHSTIDILIGADHPELTLSCEERVGNPGDPVARRTPLGWTCVGSLQSTSDVTKVHFGHTYFNASQDTKMDLHLQALWNMDVLGDSKEQPLNPNEKLALEKVERSREKIDGRYKVCIPWKSETPDLPNNRSLAERRFTSLERSLLKSPKLVERYSAAMEANIEKGYIREVKRPTSDEPSWYLPHFPVVREDKTTTKVRIVLDSAAKYAGKSLNDEMLAGPKLQQDLVEILVRFRRGTVALIGDIKEMFPQVMMEESDQNYHRILWRKIGSGEPFQEFKAARLTFGDKASPFLAQYVVRKHAEEHEKIYPLAAYACLKDMYMDDNLSSVDSTEEGILLREQLTTLLRGAGFDIKKWCSNDMRVLQDVPEEDRATGIFRVVDSELPSIKALGVLWNAKLDSFGFAGGIEAPETVTKRTLLSRVATLFDPLQFLAPFVIQAKILLQKTWLLGLTWDESLPPTIVVEVRNWFDELNKVTSFSIPRCYFRESRVQEVSLHTFSDASQEAYAAVSYIRSMDQNGVHLSMVAAKARVAPLKATSIPRLELMGAVLGHSLAMKITRLLEIGELYFWTDSMDVVHWIRSQSRTFKPFVANRVSKIQEGTLPSQWRHVPGSMNPADLATRGMTMDELNQENVWLNGPGFLLAPEREWPETKTDTFVPSEEVGKESRAVATASKFDAVMDWSRFSSWTRVRRVMAFVLRFVDQLRNRCQVHHTLNTKEGKSLPVLEAEDLERSENVLVKMVQRESFSMMLNDQTRGVNIKHGHLRNLTPFLAPDGLLRVGGRLQNSDLPYSSRHPILLPRHHHLSMLIVRYLHFEGRHVRGVNSVLYDLRVKYWIVKGRELIKEVQRSCVICKKMRGKTMVQIMAPLPSLRASVPVRAFARTGVDFGGPFLTKITRNVSAKRYLCLFTCLNTRAVHLEMAYSLDTSGFLQAFSRMVARRGKPEDMVSDNGTNFVSANRELNEMVLSLDFEKIAEDAANRGIRWRFNPPLGPHHGGIFEVMIKAAKKAIYSILGSVKVTDEELLTAIVEAEGLLNSRPLMYCGDDCQDDPVLTPNHFLYGQCGGQLAPRVIDEMSFSPRHRWRMVQDLVAQFWKRWLKEYLASIQCRGKWRKEFEDLEPGTVVMLIDPNSSRGDWPLGKVEEVFPGKDAHVRTVRVRSRGKSFLRPITRLCPLVKFSS
jgi:hypothetical protein